MREDDLPGALLWMVEHHDTFSPRAWALENMSCQRGTDCSPMRFARRPRAAENGGRVDSP